jgi:hypothetical protein
VHSAVAVEFAVTREFSVVHRFSGAYVLAIARRLAGDTVGVADAVYAAATLFSIGTAGHAVGVAVACTVRLAAAWTVSLAVAYAVALHSVAAMRAVSITVGVGVSNLFGGCNGVAVA